MTGVRRSWIAGSLLCVLVLALASSATASTVRLTTPGEDLGPGPWATIGSTLTKPGVTYSHGLHVVCTRPRGTIEITRVRPYGGVGQLRVVRFGTRPDTATRGTHRIGAGPESLASSGFDVTAPVRVTTACARTVDESRPENLTELAVELQRPSDRSASFEGVLVDYTDGETKGTLAIPIQIVFCGRDGLVDSCP